MKLYYDPISTTSRSIMMFAAEHRLALDYALVSLMEGANSQPAYLAINPNGKVPLLEEADGFRLVESSAILKYLAEKVASPAYPSEVRRRAQVNAVMDWFFGFHVNFGFNYAYPQFLANHALPDPAMQQDLLSRGRRNSEAMLQVLNDSMIGPDHNYVCGPELTLADYYGATIMALGQAVDFDLSPWPNVARWMSTLQARPSWGPTYAAFYGMLGAMRDSRLTA
jgi:glutathione S-transferase